MAGAKGLDSRRLIYSPSTTASTARATLGQRVAAGGMPCHNRAARPRTTATGTAAAVEGVLATPFAGFDGCTAGEDSARPAGHMACPVSSFATAGFGDGRSSSFERGDDASA